MKTMKKLFLVLLTCLSLGVAVSGCQQRLVIMDGQIPSQLIPHIQPYLGDYQGRFDLSDTTLSVYMRGNRLLIQSMEDLLNPRCESHIGLLKEVRYLPPLPNGQVISQAIFAFHPGLCTQVVYGREIIFSTVDGNLNDVSAEIFGYYNGSQPVFLKGRFHKVN